MKLQLSDSKDQPVNHLKVWKLCAEQLTIEGSTEWLEVKSFLDFKLHENKRNCKCPFNPNGSEVF